MDEFKKCSQKEIGVGGMKCRCCGYSSKWKMRKRLRTRTRRRLKQELRVLFKNELV